MREVTCLVLAMLSLATGPAFAQQPADPDYRSAIAAVVPAESAPRVAIDAAHANFHQIDERFAPFAMLARHGGYVVTASTGSFAAGAIDAEILVVANASQSPSAEEIDALVDWVAQGGSLLLIADHAPFGGHAAPLAARFGVAMGDGYVVVGARRDAQGNIDFRGGALGDHAILAGTGAREVDHVRSFLGQSLSVPAGASVLLELPREAVELPSRDAIALYRGGRAQGTAVGGRAQALALEHGAGRVVISGEAAMFTSQVARQGGREFRVGVGQADNEAYVLNVLDWLAHRLD